VIDDVVPHEFEALVREEMRDVLFPAGEQIVDADDFVTVLEQTIAQMRAKEAGTAGDKNAHNFPRRVQDRPVLFQQNRVRSATYAKRERTGASRVSRRASIATLNFSSRK